MAQAPWYTYPTDSPGGGYGQMIDPVCDNGRLCHYLKPDTNIAIPSGTAITALYPGTITSIFNGGASDAGLSVTEKLDTPLNSLAQYMSFNYLGSEDVSTGERISPGQQIGTAGSPTGINFALALGSDPSWGNGPGFQQNAIGNPLLNPMQVINAAKQGTLGNIQSSGPGGCPWYCSLIPAGTLKDAACSGCGSTAPGQFSPSAVLQPHFWNRIGVYLLGGAIVLIGVYSLVKGK